MRLFLHAALPAWCQWAAATSLGAQVIRGVVVDAESGTPANAPVPGATVEMTGTGAGLPFRTLTDSLGTFHFSAPRAGVYGLRVTHPAFLPYEAAGVAIGADETVSLEIRLGRHVIPLEPLIVKARVNALLAGFHQRRTGGGSGTFLTRDEIVTRGAAYAADLLRGLPGIRLEFVRWGEGPRILMQGGFGQCEPTIFLDGIEVTRTSGVGSSLNDYVTPDRIEGIEVYSSHATVPAQFRAGMCGVILVWTRQGGREGGHPWGWKRILVGLGVVVALLAWIT